MKLPAIMRSDTAAKIEQACAGLATAQGRLADLEQERAAALNGDDMNVLHRISAAVSQQQAIIRDCTDRLAVLQKRKRVENTEQQEKDRQTAIDRVIVPAASECAALATELGGIFARAAELIEAIKIKQGALNQLPPGVPRLPYYRYVTFSFLRSNLFENIARTRGQLAEIPREVRKELDGFIISCRKEPIPTSADEMEDAA